MKRRIIYWPHSDSFCHPDSPAVFKSRPIILETFFYKNKKNFFRAAGVDAATQEEETEEPRHSSFLVFVLLTATALHELL